MNVNRSLNDKAMDRIDHALGRPLNPRAETARKYFAVEAGSAEAAEMAQSPHWINCGQRQDMQWFEVTPAGREALCAHLIEIGDAHRVYVVEIDAVEIEQVAVSHAKARYAAWLGVRDNWNISFADFCSRSSVRVQR